MSVNILGDSSPTTSCSDLDKNQLVSIVQKKSEIIDKLENEISEIRDELATRAERNAKARRRISKQEERIEDLEAKVENTESCTDSGQNESSKDQCSASDSEGEDSETTSLEQVASLPDEVANDSLTSNQKRARKIARRIDEYGKSVPAGHAITSTRIRDILSGLEDKRIHRQTVQRVADFLKRFGGDHVERKQTRGGKDVVVFSESVVKDITSVVTGDKDLGVTPAIL
jgi:outer membrane murein-binding lipoprotein Lpp